MGWAGAFLNFFPKLWPGAVICLNCNVCIKEKASHKLYFLIIKFKVYLKLLIVTVVKLPVVVIFQCLLLYILKQV